MSGVADAVAAILYFMTLSLSFASLSLSLSFFRQAGVRVAPHGASAHPPVAGAKKLHASALEGLEETKTRTKDMRKTVCTSKQWLQPLCGGTRKESLDDSHSFLSPGLLYGRGLPLPLLPLSQKG